MIRTERLVKTFGSKTAVDALDLAVEPGEVFGFLGPNGAGKSTTVKILTGLLRPDSGRAIVAGHDLEREPLAARRRISFVPERPPRLPAHTSCVPVPFRRRITGRGDLMAVKPIPDGYSAVTPYVIARDVDQVLDFVKRAFDATEVDVHRDGTGRVMHADVMIGDAHIMMGQANEKWPERRGSIHLYVPDADATHKAAVAAGAKSLYDVTTHFYGDRSGGVEDPAGIAWWISTHVEDVSPEEMQRRMQAQQA